MVVTSINLLDEPHINHKLICPPTDLIFLTKLYGTLNVTTLTHTRLLGFNLSRFQSYILLTNDSATKVKHKRKQSKFKEP